FATNHFPSDFRLVDRERAALIATAAAALVATAAAALVAAARATAVTATADRLTLLVEADVALFLVLGDPFDLLPLLHHDFFRVDWDLDATGLGHHFRVRFVFVRRARNDFLLL